MPMGANSRRNDGSIRPAEWRRNGTKHVAASPQTRSHQPNNARRHWETYNTRKNINNCTQNKFLCFYEQKLNLFKRFAFDCWHNSVLCYTTNNTQHNKQYTTQQTIHNTTNNTQHKIHSCYIISFVTIFGRFWRDGLFELIGLGTGAVEHFVDSDTKWLLGLDAQSFLYIRHIRNWIHDGRLSRPPSASSKFRN